MKQTITAMLFCLAFLVSGQTMATEQASDVVKKPTAKQVLSFTDALAKTPTADRKVASEALQKWMNGKLTIQEAEKYKNALKLDVEKAPPQLQPMNADLCKACKLGCGLWFGGFDPVCIAICEETACK